MENKTTHKEKIKEEFFRQMEKLKGDIVDSNMIKVIWMFFDDYIPENYIDAICESYKKDFQNLPETEKDKYREECAKWLKAILSKDIGIK